MRNMLLFLYLVYFMHDVLIDMENFDILFQLREIKRDQLPF